MVHDDTSAGRSGFPVQGSSAMGLRFVTWVGAGLLPGCLLATAVAAAEPRRVLFLGDSIAWGTGASAPQQRFTSLVVTRLNERENGRFEQLSLAVRGSALIDRAWRPLDAAHPHGLARAIALRPDVVVIAHGSNDNAFGHSLGEFLWAYRDSVRALRRKLPRAQIVCMTISPRWESMLSDDDWLNRANVGIQEIAALERTRLARSHAKLRSRRELFPDGIHPNDEGHRLLAESVLEALAGDVQTPERFDLAFAGPGRHRVAGYTIEAHARPDASPGSGDEAGWVEIQGLSLDGLRYRSDYALTIGTAPRTCQRPPKLDLRAADGSRHQWLGECTDWYRTGRYRLPASPDAATRVEIRR
jgi:lysophospholipase L1-like esterase